MPSNKSQTVNVVVKRIIDAPVDLVWQAWTDPEQVVKWWGPSGFTSPSAKIDLREGGKYVFAMQAGPEMGGQVSYTAGEYLKIEPKKRLEFTQGLADAEGNLLTPDQLPEGFPEVLHTVIEFKSLRGDMTELLITEHNWIPGQMYVFALAGMQQSIDKLAESLQA